MATLTTPDGKPVEWWVVETDLNGPAFTAFPGKQIAMQGRDLLLQQGFSCKLPRRGNPYAPGDRLAVAAAKQEIVDLQTAKLAKSAGG